MGIVATQLDKMRKARSIASDRALAALLDVKPQTVSLWRSGDAYPEEDRIAQIAEANGDHPGEILLLVRAERATGPAAKAYGSLVERLGLAAILALAAFPALASISQKTPGCLYYVTRLARLARFLTRSKFLTTRNAHGHMLALQG